MKKFPLSSAVIADVIRDGIGFHGVLVSDDLSMQALGGTLGERASRALAAGCDVVLHCNGRFDEMHDVADSVGPLSDAAIRRVTDGEARRLQQTEPVDRTALEARVDAWFPSA